MGDPVAESKRLVAAATGKGLTVRVLGGVAVCLQAPPEGPLLARTCGDIDVATPRGRRRETIEMFQEAGYASDEMFNALHGARRLLFYDDINSRKLDVFVGDFTMCHAIPITDRLDREPLTVPLAELLLTKLQVIQLNEKDVRDAVAVLHDRELGDKDGDTINAGRIAELCSEDWGLWRTITRNLEACRQQAGAYGEDLAQVADRFSELEDRIEAEPKSRAWRMRAKIGERKRWYDLPEERA